MHITKKAPEPNTMSTKIAIIGTAGIPANYGGFETLAEYLTRHLAEKFKITVFCSSKNYDKKQTSCNNARLVYIPFNANGVQSILYDVLSMFKALFFADTFLILGVSGCIVLPFIRMLGRKHIVVNIDGLEWKRDKWNIAARWFLKFSEKIAVNFSSKVITDNKAIQDYVKKEYGLHSSLIAYGADHVSRIPLSDEIKKTFLLSNEKYAFTVCRIEPENNIHIILKAFSSIDHPLIMIGNWQNSRYGRELKIQFSQEKNIHLCDPVYDLDILNQLRSNATLYIHGHSAGGTNPSLVEAMYSGLPIIAFDINYNRETTQNQAVYFENSMQLQEILKQIINGALEINGNKMREIANQKYLWKDVVKKYEQLLVKY